jgi:hypothetical protein
MIMHRQVWCGVQHQYSGCTADVQYCTAPTYGVYRTCSDGVPQPAVMVYHNYSDGVLQMLQCHDASYNVPVLLCSLRKV